MTDSDLDEVVTIAQNLARNCGYAVFPVLADKRPAIKGGFHAASKEPDRIAEMFRTVRGPLIGIATGSVSGIDVLDQDAKHALSEQWLNVARDKMPQPTRTYRTPSGGQHLYFRHAEGVRNSQGKLATGIDTRGDGGYVVFWFASGHECLNPSPPAPWPDWLLQCVRWQPAPEPQPKHAGSSETGIGGLVRFVVEAKEGDRNAKLFWAAVKLNERVAGGQIGQQHAKGALLAAAAACGLDRKSAAATIASGFAR